MEESMASFEQLDLLLGEALENMMAAAAEIRALDAQKAKDYLRHIGMAIKELWAIREDVYSIRPDIKRDFVAEFECDPQRYEQLNGLHHRAVIAEEEGDIASARALYTELRNTSTYDWFKLLVEAGLFRTSEAERT
jgi:hypothetical protein